MFHHTCVCAFADIFTCFAGELPKELGQLTNLTIFDISDNVLYEKNEDGDDDYDRPIPGTGFTGELYASCYIIQRTWFHMHVITCTGPLPKLLPVSLEVLIFGVSSGNTNKFTGGIPSEWGALTNLKELRMEFCGLDGKICMTRPTFTLWAMHITALCVRAQ